MRFSRGSKIFRTDVLAIGGHWTILVVGGLATRLQVEGCRLLGYRFSRAIPLWDRCGRGWVDTSRCRRNCVCQGKIPSESDRWLRAIVGHEDYQYVFLHWWNIEICEGSGTIQLPSMVDLERGIQGLVWQYQRDVTSIWGQYEVACWGLGWIWYVWQTSEFVGPFYRWQGLLLQF